MISMLEIFLINMSVNSWDNITKGKKVYSPTTHQPLKTLCNLRTDIQNSKCWRGLQRIL